MGYINLFIYSFTSLFIIMNPIGLAPLFYIWTVNNTEKEVIHILKRTTVVVILTLLIFGFFGKYIFNFFGITINSFKVIGGLLILKISWDMLHAKMSKIKQTQKEKEEMSQLEDIAVVPLGIPLLAGPGSITTTIILMEHATGILDKLIIVISIFLATGVSVFILYISEKIVMVLRTSGINAVVRIMGLILGAISIEIIWSGLVGMFSSLIGK
ncbi:MAG TPA: NAAT family transporter [Methanothermococcus okinawensis]|nr:NAAT family transporter [Methanofervidicoccus abyssi]HIP16548.1 NAAT family transporter [Methanothermococcus okinawensis]